MIVGVNGSGKSTLCSILSGINKSYTGIMILNDDTEVKGCDFTDKVSYMIQEFGQYNLSVKDNILLGRKVGDSEYEKIFDILNLHRSVDKNKENFQSGTLDSQGRNLSKGQ